MANKTNEMWLATPETETISKRFFRENNGGGAFIAFS